MGHNAMLQDIKFTTILRGDVVNASNHFPMFVHITDTVTFQAVTLPYYQSLKLLHLVRLHSVMGKAIIIAFA